MTTNEQQRQLRGYVRNTFEESFSPVTPNGYATTALKLHAQSIKWAGSVASMYALDLSVLQFKLEQLSASDSAAPGLITLRYTIQADSTLLMAEVVQREEYYRTLAQSQLINARNAAM